MRFLVDTNILLHAVNTSSPSHEKARRFIEEHLRIRTAWCLTWTIVYEFLRVATHNRVFQKPLNAKQALAFIGGLIAMEEIIVLTPTDRHLAVLETVVAEVGHPAGNLFHDIHTATVMREYGIREIITADTDFLQFRFLSVSNPLR